MSPTQIPNACGTIGLLHALINVGLSFDQPVDCDGSWYMQSNVTFVPDSPLANFVSECQGMGALLIPP